MQQFSVKSLSEIHDAKIIEFNYNEDARGDIYTSYNFKDLDLGEKPFLHDKFSRSRVNVLRGFHGDKKSDKIVTCVYGEVLQVIFDNRADSPTYRNVFSVTNSHSKYFSLFIPAGVLNAYLVLSPEAVYHYKYRYEGEYADVNEQITKAWDDSFINFQWPITTPVLSWRDQNA